MAETQFRKDSLSLEFQVRPLEAAASVATTRPRLGQTRRGRLPGSAGLWPPTPFCLVSGRFPAWPSLPALPAPYPLFPWNPVVNHCISLPGLLGQITAHLVAYNNRSLFPHRSEGKSKLKVLEGQSLWRLWKGIFPGLLQVWGPLSVLGLWQHNSSHCLCHHIAGSSVHCNLVWSHLEFYHKYICKDPSSKKVYVLKFWWPWISGSCYSTHHYHILFDFI